MPRTALALLLTACATPSQPFEGHPVLVAIKFEGNKSIGSGELLSKIATSPTSGFFSKTARYYDADLFAIDEKRIVRWYNEKGYYEAKILDVQEVRDEAGRVTLVVKIDEGRRAVVKTIDYQGLDDVPKDEASDIEDALPLRTGDGFDEDQYEKTKDVVKNRLKERGFAQAEVNGRVEVAPEDGAAHIWFDCDTGPRFHFGKVVVTGNRQISSNEISSATGIEKGQTYSPQAIALAQQRVYNLGTFSGVRVQLEPLGDSPVASVRVNVHEAPFQTFRFGIGGSAEETRWELPRLHGEYTNRSLFGGLRRLELSSTVGYAFVNSPFDYDPRHSGITAQNSAQLTVPNIIFPGLEWISRGEFSREVQGGYAYDDVAARTGLLYRRGNHSIAPSINFIHYFLVDLYQAGLADVLGRGGQAAGIVHDCPTHCTLTYPELRYTYDGRDNAIEPTQGFYFSTSIQQTLKPGTFSYFRINPEIRVYTPATRFAVIALRAEYGGLFTETAEGASPFTQRFFFGGQNEQRGYAPLRQGPKIGACNEGNPTCPFARIGVPIGGKYAALFSAELRVHTDFILNHLGMVAFVDASRVQNDKNVLSGGLEFAPGLGLRYITPFGPIRFDVAWVANPKDVVIPADGTVVLNNTTVSTVCHKADPTCIFEARWAFHLTLGEAF
ncbi:MAG: outer membrane protein assembly factor [Myxococcales bacterium]|nr:BamA/TamA family outer membrane protein [Myxococcales bacterium]